MNMKDSKLTAEWQEYDGDYEKRIQDIRTKDGNEYCKCWPNAGKWHVLSDEHGLQILNEEVTHVKLNKEELE